MSHEKRYSKQPILDDNMIVTTRQSLPISLLRTRELIMRDIRPILQKYELTEQQWRFLRVVSEFNHADASLIADKACLLAPSVTRILRNLVKRGYVTSHTDPTDKRRLIVKITDDAKILIQQVLQETNHTFEQMRHIVGEKRWEQLVNLLMEIRDDINQASKR
ncbi:MAG: homoprotocatechuate degradation operon regulator HpaR [Alphaproteobacteria bacterium]|nr:homoprotocatechuate degradation operon regulator HpaR [Alphaproteobacteria bacterium]